MDRWQILPIFVQGECGIKGIWFGDYASAETALAAIDEAFLQDPKHWDPDHWIVGPDYYED